MTFPVSRQGLEQLAMFFILGAVLFALLALLARRRDRPWRRFATSAGMFGGVVVVSYLLAYTVAPNIPVLPVPFTARFAQDPVPDTQDSIERGREVYQANCVICHGPRGIGNGPMAPVLQPPPANLQVHVPQHAPGELFYWISEGVPNTQMPVWKNTLSETDRWSTIRYLQALVAGRVPN